MRAEGYLCIVLTAAALVFARWEPAEKILTRQFSGRTPSTAWVVSTTTSSSRFAIRNAPALADVVAIRSPYPAALEDV